MQLRQVVNRQVTHLTRLVDDLLDVARITSSKVVLKKSNILLKAVVRHALEISSSGMEAKNHRIEVIEPETPYVLDVDHARLVQSVANLLVNAAKFTPANGHIVLEITVEANTVTFSAKDNGIGLEPASIDRIFELFAQTPVPGEAPTGLGIGLSLAKQFAEMHGGVLRASSDGLGKGSEFVLALPVVLQGVLPAEPEVTPQLEMPGSRKILVVDDNLDAANTLEALLGMDGFEVTTVYNGVAAVASAKTFKPDVVVMDIGMSGMDGYDAARMIRQEPGSEKMVLIALTGWGQSSDIQRAIQAGFNYHLVKPVDYETLMKCLQG